MATTRDATGRLTPGPLPAGIELRHLRYFLAVVDELHFGRAAERLHISQPPLSQAIRKLEDHLGVQLLDRSTRAVTPTDAGEIFATAARRVLASFDSAIAEARTAGGVGTRLRIGCTEHIEIERLQRFLTSLRRRLPDARPEVTHLLAREQVERLMAGDLDLAIFRYAEDNPDVEMAPLFPGDPLAAYMPAVHRLARRRAIAPHDVAGVALVMFPRPANPALHDRILELVDDAGYRFASVREAGGATPRDLMLAVVNGAGVALQGPAFMHAGPPGGLVVRRPLAHDVLLPPTVVAWRTRPPRHLRPAVAVARRIAAALLPATAAKQPPVR